MPTHTTADHHDDDAPRARRAGAGDWKRDVWMPPGLPTFKVGDRVRIRLSGECEKRPHAESDQAADGFRGHAPWEDGLTGVVDHADCQHKPAASQGHPIAVWWDHPPAGIWARASHYAAAELVPLTD